MATKERITRREVTDPVALQTVVDQLRERVNTEDAATNTHFIGPWFLLNVAATSGGAMSLITSVTATKFVAPRAGTLLGVTALMSTAPTAGILRVKAVVTEDGTATTVDDHEMTLTEDWYLSDFAPYAFKQGARLSFSFTADANLLPDGSADLTTWLEVKM